MHAQMSQHLILKQHSFASVSLLHNMWDIPDSAAVQLTAQSHYVILSLKLPTVFLQQPLDPHSCSWSVTSSTGTIRIVQLSIGAQKWPCILFITTKLYSDMVSCLTLLQLAFRLRKLKNWCRRPSWKSKITSYGSVSKTTKEIKWISVWSILLYNSVMFYVQIEHVVCNINAVSFLFPLPLRNTITIGRNDDFTEDMCHLFMCQF